MQLPPDQARPTRTVMASLVGLGLAVAACGTDSRPSTSPDATTAARATWYQDVGPIVAKHCMSCHQAGGIAPFPLTDVDDVRTNATRALAQIDAGKMPPFDAREEADCAPRFNWVDDPRLTSDEKQKLRDWVSDGFALGVERAIPTPPITTLSGVTRTVKPVEPFVTQGDRDQFTCFVLDPGTTQLAWLDGVQVRPGNDKVVHHVVLSELEAGTKQTELIAAHGLGKPFDCSTMANPNLVVNIWTPGNQPMETPAGLAVPILPGAKLLMQIHYHPAGVTNAPDVTAIDLRFTPVTPRRMYLVGAFGNEPAAPALLPDPDDTGAPEFLVPRNAADHTEHMRKTFEGLGALTDIRVFSVNPHMHLVGTHISGKIERPAARGADPQRECLANGAWNFDWQRTYIYDARLDDMPSLKAGDIIDVTCHWNNTIQNPFVQRMLNDSHLPPSPVTIALGEQTTNEMCLEIIGLSVAVPAQLRGDPGSAATPIPTTMAALSALR